MCIFTNIQTYIRTYTYTCTYTYINVHTHTYAIYAFVLKYANYITYLRIDFELKVALFGFKIPALLHHIDYIEDMLFIRAPWQKSLG